MGPMPRGRQRFALPSGPTASDVKDRAAGMIPPILGALQCEARKGGGSPQMIVKTPTNPLAKFYALAH